MSDLLEQVERSIVQRQLLAPGESFLVAVSGGVDSMTLLHLLHRLSSEFGWSLAAGHFNHQLRGCHSDADERFVRAAAKDLGIKVRVGRGNVKVQAERTGLSMEMAARFLRYQFLARAARSLGINKVVFGHHADDQLELFFLRLLRGTSPEGLAGMKPISLSPFNDGIAVVRPLLEVTRRDLEAFAQEQQIRFRHDHTNDQPICQRNEVRHELLPFLRERFQPNFGPEVLRLMEILQVESDLVDQVTREWQSTRVPDFEHLHVAVQRRWLLSECLRLGVSPEFDLIEKLRSNTDCRLMVRPGQVLWRDQAGDVHSGRTQTSSPKAAAQQDLNLSPKRGEVTFGKLRIEWDIKPWRGGAYRLPPPVPGCERFDADKVGSTVLLRYWFAGDRFQPIGMPTAAKVQNLFTNLKVPPLRRHDLAFAVTSQGDIFWIEGLRIAEQFKITLATRRCLEWRWRRRNSD